jgi:hypothetical protein
VLKPSGFTGYAIGTFGTQQIRVGFPGTRFKLGGAPTVPGQRQRVSTPRVPTQPVAPTPTQPKQPKQPKQPTAPKPPRA